MPYAENTDVSIERSKAEIERIVLRAGATSFASSFEQTQKGIQAAVLFRMNGKVIRFLLPLPGQEEFRFTDAKRRERSDVETFKQWEQGCKSRWRALFLCIKAKIESIESGIEEFEEAFLPQIVLANKRTVYEHVQETLPEAASGSGQLLALPSPKRN